MRASDIGIVSPVDATVVTSGAAAVTIDRINGAGIHYVTEGRPGFFRDVRRDRALQPVHQPGATSPTRSPSRSRGRPVDYLPWGRRGGAAGGPAGHDASARGFSRAGTPPRGATATAATSTRTPTRPRATSSPPTPCWCCGSRSATPATATRPATRCPRPSSRARATRCCSTPAGSCGAPGSKDALERTASSCRPRRARSACPAGHTWIELVPADERRRHVQQVAAFSRSSGSPVGVSVVGQRRWAARRPARRAPGSRRA